MPCHAPLISPVQGHEMQKDNEIQMKGKEPCVFALYANDAQVSDALYETFHAVAHAAAHDKIPRLLPVSLSHLHYRLQQGLTI